MPPLPPKAKSTLLPLHTMRRAYYLIQQYSASTTPYHWRLLKSRKRKEDTNVGSALPKPFSANSGWHLAFSRPNQITLVCTDGSLQTARPQKTILQSTEALYPRWWRKMWTEIRCGTRLCTRRGHCHFYLLPKHPQTCCCLCAEEANGCINYLFLFFHRETITTALHSVQDMNLNNFYSHFLAVYKDQVAVNSIAGT